MTAHLLENLIERSANSAIRAAMARGQAIADIGTAQLNCAKHGVFTATGKGLTHREVWTTCPVCRQSAIDDEAEERRLTRERAEDSAHQSRLTRAAVPARFAGKTLKSFKAESADQKKALAVSCDYVQNWGQNAKKGAWLVFSGQPGTGKSHLAIAILQAIMPRDIGRYMTCMELIHLLRSTWRKDSEISETDMLDKITDLPLLVLDEIGVQNGTDSEQNHLFDVLDRRYREMRPTILLTNQNKEGFKAFVGERVYDRMTEVARWVPFVWPSYRPTARKEIGDA